MGDPAFNLELSRQRAQSVADYLVDGGVALDRLIVEGAGATQPVADNTTSYGRRQNRRIEFWLEQPAEGADGRAFPASLGNREVVLLGLQRPEPPPPGPLRLRV